MCRRFKLTFSPPFRPAARASSGVNSWALPFSWAALPPLRAISFCRWLSIDANPRFLVVRVSMVSTDSLRGAATVAASVTTAGRTTPIRRCNDAIVRSITLLVPGTSPVFCRHQHDIGRRRVESPAGETVRPATQVPSGLTEAADLSHFGRNLREGMGLGSRVWMPTHRPYTPDPRPSSQRPYNPSTYVLPRASAALRHHHPLQRRVHRPALRPLPARPALRRAAVASFFRRLRRRRSAQSNPRRHPPRRAAASARCFNHLRLRLGP